MIKFPTQGAAATVGLFVAPLVPTIAPAFYAGAGVDDFTSAFFGVFLTYVTALLLGGVLGLPLFYLLGLLRQVNLWACVIAGFVSGAVAALLIILLTGVGSGAIMIYGLQGAGAATAFWLFWIMGPDPSASFARSWTREFAGS